MQLPKLIARRAGPGEGEFEGLLALSRRDAPALAAELDRLSADEARRLAGDDGRFASWGLVELLCEESRAIAGENFHRALALGELAVAAATRTKGQRLPEGGGEALQMLALAALGNAYRVNDELPAAGLAFQLAGAQRRLLTAGAFPVLQVEALSLEASFEIDRRSFPAAFARLDEALALARGLEQPQPAAEARLQLVLSQALVETRRIDEAIAACGRAAALAATATGTDRDLRLRFIATHNQVFFLSELGRYGEAEALLPDVEALGALHGTGTDWLRLDWVKARLLQAKGNWQQASGLLEYVRRAFIAAGQCYSGALVALERATLLFEAGRLAEVQQIAADLVGVFSAQAVHREALAAITLFKEAAQTSTLNQSLLVSMLTYLRRAEHDPGLRFVLVSR